MLWEQEWYRSQLVSMVRVLEKMRENPDDAQTWEEGRAWARDRLVEIDAELRARGVDPDSLD